MSVDSIMSMLNPVIGAVLRSPLHRLVSPGLLLLTVTGRRTGRRYSIPVGYQRDGDDLVVMVSEARSKQWWRNYEEPAPIEMRLRGEQRSGVAERSEAVCSELEANFCRAESSTGTGMVGRSGIVV